MKDQPQTNQLVQVHQNLERLLKEKVKALPRNFNQTRFLQNAMVVLQDVKGIEKAQPISIARTMLKGAFLGLDFFNKECYAIVYGDQVNFQTDYKGEIKLAKKYSLKKIHDIYAKLVREGDLFEESIQQGKQVINFKPKSFNDAKIIGAFAVCLYDDGSMLYESMSEAEINHVRKTYSKMPDGKAWKDSFGEMSKKTVLRRLCKLIELEFESYEQNEAWQDGSDSRFPNAEEIQGEIIEEKKVEDLEEKLKSRGKKKEEPAPAPDESQPESGGILETWMAIEELNAEIGSKLVGTESIKFKIFYDKALEVISKNEGTIDPAEANNWLGYLKNMKNKLKK